MSSLAIVSAFFLFSALPVARAELECQIKINDHNVCDWANNNLGLGIAVVGGIVGWLVLLFFIVSALRSRDAAAKARSTDPINYAPRDPPQLPVPRPLSMLQTQPYPFAVQGQGWKEFAKDGPASPADDAKDFKGPSSSTSLGPPPRYVGYAV